MNVLIKFSFCLLFLLFISECFFAQVAGKVYKDSGCASGGFDFYFFNDNTVIAECDGCEYIPYIVKGSWSISCDNVIVNIEQEWYGKGEGDVLYVAAINHYEHYVARYFKGDKYDLSFQENLDIFLSGETESCVEIGSFSNKSSDLHDWLRCDMEGDYPETYLRLLTDSDLKNKTKKELRLMRNEIYARYGYIFGSDDFKTHFEKMTGYCKFSKDVEAFLSETEKMNVELIQAYEKK